MSITTEFYQAINRANSAKPKEKVVKPTKKEEIPVENQIAQLLKVSESAVIIEEVNDNNEKFVELLYNFYKKDEETLLKEKEEERLWKEIENKREVARKEWRILQKMQEKISLPLTTTSVNVGSGGLKKKLKKYYEEGYIDPDYIE